MTLAMLALLAMTSVTLAQPLDTAGPRPRYGVFGGLVQTVHASDFNELVPSSTNITYLTRFDGGKGAGLSFGGLFELPIAESLWLGLRGSYHSEDAELRTTERTTVIVADTGTRDGTFERRIDTRITSFGIEPVVSLDLPLSFAVSAGGRVAFVLSNSFEQRDVLTEPMTEGVFGETMTRVRADTSGAIPGVSTVQTSAQLGVSRSFPLDRHGAWFLVPELLFSYALTPVSDRVEWNAHGVRLGLALKHAPLPAAPAPPPPPPPPPPVEPPVLVADVQAVSIEADGVERKGVTIRVEEFISTQMRPLLNYVFFEQESSDIAPRYRTLSPTEARSFDVNKLHGADALATYYDLLNVVGRRMTLVPNAKITLTGTNSGVGAERDNIALSTKRAESVRSYLASVWGIADDRIDVRARNLPEVPSDTMHTEAAQENSRVEISATDPSILDAVTTEDTVRTVSPPLVRFIPSVRSEAGVGSWQITARQGASTVASFSGSGSVPPTVDWTPSTSSAFSTSSNEPIVYALVVNDAAGQDTRVEGGPLRVEQVTLRRKREEGSADRRTDRYGLILFGYNRSDLNAANARLASLIRSRIPKDASVSITAFTDRLGEVDHNQKLSEARAFATARALGVPEAVAKGVGETSPPYSNDLPEGRFYSRTVEVIVESVIR